ncbi:MAG: LLM class flavin-dependent oxidoreductase [Sphingobium sp.]
MTRMRFGIFMPGFHTDLSDDVTSCFDRDIEVIQIMDRLGFDEVWIGEHHSGGAELIADPISFAAYVAAKTQHIDLGLGVVSLPYHNPLMVADRVIQLDHLTRGRMIFGAGAGGLPSDAEMLGLDPRELRDALEFDLDIIMRLLNGDEAVSAETDRYTLRNARCQLMPYSQPIRMGVAGIASPTGARLAGRHGMALLSLGATSPEGFEALAGQWSVIEQQAMKYGRPQPERKDWRLLGPMHIAETREQAIEDVRHGLVAFAKYTRDVCAVPHFRAASDNFDELVNWINGTGVGVIGTAEDAIKQIERLEAKSGGFGTYLMLHAEWANRDATRKHFELFANYVKPALQKTNRRRRASEQWCIENLAEMDAKSSAAIAKAIAKQESESNSNEVGKFTSPRERA